MIRAMYISTEGMSDAGISTEKKEAGMEDLQQNRTAGGNGNRGNAGGGNAGGGRIVVGGMGG
jgi:hypothetical protein